MCHSRGARRHSSGMWRHNRAAISRHKYSRGIRDVILPYIVGSVMEYLFDPDLIRSIYLTQIWSGVFDPDLIRDVWPRFDPEYLTQIWSGVFDPDLIRSTRVFVQGHLIRGTRVFDLHLIRGTRAFDPGYEGIWSGVLGHLFDPGYKGIWSGVRGHLIRGTRAFIWSGVQGYLICIWSGILVQGHLIRVRYLIQIWSGVQGYLICIWSGVKGGGGYECIWSSRLDSRS